jgi:hypothetical protein
VCAKDTVPLQDVRATFGRMSQVGLRWLVASLQEMVIGIDG